MVMCARIEMECTVRNVHAMFVEVNTAFGEGPIGALLNAVEQLAALHTACKRTRNQNLDHYWHTLVLVIVPSPLRSSPLGYFMRGCTAALVEKSGRLVIRIPNPPDACSLMAYM